MVAFSENEEEISKNSISTASAVLVNEGKEQREKKKKKKQAIMCVFC
jgi:hypothetical protein